MTESTTRRRTFQQVKRYAILGYGAIGTMLDVGLMVLGGLLVGLSLAVLLAGFGLVDITTDLATASILISAIVLGVSGLFCLGVASEGPLGRGRRLIGFKVWEVGIGRALAVVGVGFGLFLLYELATGFLDGLPDPLHQGAEGIRAVGVAGMTVMPIVGVPLSLAARGIPVNPDWLRRMDVPVMFVVWAVASLVILT